VWLGELWKRGGSKTEIIHGGGGKKLSEVRRSLRIGSPEVVKGLLGGVFWWWGGGGGVGGGVGGGLEKLITAISNGGKEIKMV